MDTKVEKKEVRCNKSRVLLKSNVDKLNAQFVHPHTNDKCSSAWSLDHQFVSYHNCNISVFSILVVWLSLVGLFVSLRLLQMETRIISQITTNYLP